MAQKQIKKTTADKTEDVVEETSKDTKKREELLHEIDDLLDEIDDILEQDAAEFVKSYVQKGGE